MKSLRCGARATGRSGDPRALSVATSLRRGVPCVGDVQEMHRVRIRRAARAATTASPPAAPGPPRARRRWRGTRRSRRPRRTGRVRTDGARGTPGSRGRRQGTPPPEARAPPPPTARRLRTHAHARSSANGQWSETPNELRDGRTASVPVPARLTPSTNLVPCCAPSGCRARTDLDAAPRSGRGDPRCGAASARDRPAPAGR